MAIYWLDGKYVSRRQGRTFSSAMAYRSGQKLYCIFDGHTQDYSRRRDVVCAEIFLPENAPREYLAFQNLCNAVESAEKRTDARTAREIVIALPKELIRSNLSKTVIMIAGGRGKLERRESHFAKASPKRGVNRKRKMLYYLNSGSIPYSDYPTPKSPIILFEKR